jgi:hypothetical protein
MRESTLGKESDHGTEASEALADCDAVTEDRSAVAIVKTTLQACRNAEVTEQSNRAGSIQFCDARGDRTF